MRGLKPQNIGVSMPHGFAGSYARQPDMIVNTHPAGGTEHIAFGAPLKYDAGGAAATGALVGVVKSAALGDSSVSYDTDALTKATADWGDLNATQYGQLLATRARLAGMGGTYVI